jgi:hypothetical protein
MPRKVSNSWNKTSKTFLKDLGDLHTKCTSLVFGLAVTANVINVVASHHYLQVVADQETHGFLRQVTGLSQVYSSINPLLPSLPSPAPLVRRPEREYDSRVATLCKTVESAEFQQQAEQFLFFTVKPGTTNIHFRSSPGLSQVRDLLFWQQNIEGIVVRSAVRSDRTATASTSNPSSRGQARRAPAASSVADAPRRVRRRQADGVLHGLDAEQNTDLWYSTRLQLDPSLYTPIRLPNHHNPSTGVEERCWALPNLDVANGSIGRTPVQVRNVCADV